MRKQGKKKLYLQLQEASVITSLLGALGASMSTIISDGDVTPYIVSTLTVSASLATLLITNTIENKKINKLLSEREKDSDSCQVYRIMSNEEFEEKESQFQRIEPAYTKEDNILSVDFEQISDLRKQSKKLTYKNRSN